MKKENRYTVVLVSLFALAVLVGCSGDKNTSTVNAKDTGKDVESTVTTNKSCNDHYRNSIIKGAESGVVCAREAVMKYSEGADTSKVERTIQGCVLEKMDELLAPVSQDDACYDDMRSGVLEGIKIGSTCTLSALADAISDDGVDKAAFMKDALRCVRLDVTLALSGR